jgi:hypothetical protein
LKYGQEPPAPAKKKLILLVFSLSHYVVGGSCGEPAKKKQIKFIFSLLLSAG